MPIQRMTKMMYAGAGAFALVCTASWLAAELQVLLMIAPFGATCVLVFALPESPLAQPRNVIGGHLICAAIGLLCLHTFGVAPWSLGLAVGAAIVGMQLTRTIHPPAGANPLLIMLMPVGWSFLVTPILAGTVLIVLAASIYHRLFRRRYPATWL